MARTPGAKNRVTSCVKDNMLRAFEDLGGRDAVVRWAKKNDENYRQFLGWYFRMLPRELIADVRHNHVHSMSRDELETLLQSNGLDPAAVLEHIH